MTKTPPDAILMVTDILTNLNRKRVMDFASEHHLPAIYEYASLVHDGGLMSYGPEGSARRCRSSRRPRRCSPSQALESRDCTHPGEPRLGPRDMLEWIDPDTLH